MSTSAAIILTLGTMGFALYVAKVLGLVTIHKTSKFAHVGEMVPVHSLSYDEAETYAMRNGGRIVNHMGSGKLKVRELRSENDQLLGLLVVWPNRTYQYLDTAYCMQLDIKPIDAQ